MRLLHSCIRRAEFLGKERNARRTELVMRALAHQHAVLQRDRTPARRATQQGEKRAEATLQGVDLIHAAARTVAARMRCIAARWWCRLSPLQSAKRLSFWPAACSCQSRPKAPGCRAAISSSA